MSSLSFAPQSNSVSSNNRSKEPSTACRGVSIRGCIAVLLATVGIGTLGWFVRVHASTTQDQLLGLSGLACLALAAIISIQSWRHRLSSLDADTAHQASSRQEEVWNYAVVNPQRGLIEQLEQRLQTTFGRIEDQQWYHVFESQSDGLFVTDLEENVTRINHALRALLHLEADVDPSGWSVEQLFGHYAQDTSAITQKLCPGIKSFTVEFQRTHELEDGLLRVSRSVLFDDQREPAGAVWTVRDITQQKLSEEMRNQFVFTATHELRTPLGNIKAYAETLAELEDLDIESQREFCNTINTEATRLARFVDELLNISQMEGGALRIVRHETEIERLIHDVIDNVRPQMEQKSQRFEAVIPPKLPKLQIDKDKIAASLVNLLGNASKYTPDEGTVRFEIEQTEADVKLHIVDTGYGIAEEEIPKIFDKFFRSEDDRVQGLTGNGLGLAFTKEVARLHGGKLNVTSELDKGSRFTMVLPIL